MVLAADRNESTRNPQPKPAAVVGVSSSVGVGVVAAAGAAVVVASSVVVTSAAGKRTDDWNQQDNRSQHE